jgi:hypothetical protein
VVKSFELHLKLNPPQVGLIVFFQRSSPVQVHERCMNVS